METLAQLLVAACELLEAESHARKRDLVRLLAAVGVGIIVLALALTGMFAWLAAAYLVLSKALSPAGAETVLGAAALLLAAMGSLWIRRLLKSPAPMPERREDAHVEKAKALLKEAAARVDPLAPVRLHPWVSVAAAAIVGSGLASSGRQLEGLMIITRWLAAVAPFFAVSSARQDKGPASTAAS